MALEVLSGAVYRDPTKNVPNVPEPVAMNIVEVPAVAKTTGDNPAGSESENGQNRQASEKQIKQAVRDANNKMKMMHRTRCEFSYHEETKRVSIKVYDEDTREVIREIPPEETLQMIEKMWELAGILVDEKR